MCPWGKVKLGQAEVAWQEAVVEVGEEVEEEEEEARWGRLMLVEAAQRRSEQECLWAAVFWVFWCVWEPGRWRIQEHQKARG